MFKRFMPVLLAASAFAVTPAHASLLGVQVNGSLTFGSNTTNYFLPANGFVPAGYGNTAGQPVTIGNPIIEFGFDDGANLDTADFTATQLIVRDLVQTAGGNNSWQMTFTSLTPGAFGGLSLVTSSFNPGLTFGLAADTITINWAGGTFQANTDYTAVFDLASGAVPEPATWAMMISGFGLIGATMRRRVAKVGYATA